MSVGPLFITICAASGSGGMEVIMTVRSIKLKMKTQTDPESLQLRKALWKTHQLLNEGVAYYMYWLILLRQDSYINEEGREYKKEEIQKELLEKVSGQQKRNDWQGDLGSLDILIPLRKLYELIVPSSIGEKGDSQISARKYLSPLVDPDSQGGKGTAKSGRKPRWQKMKEDGNPEWEEEYKKDMTKKESDPTTSILTELENYGLKPLIPLFTEEIKDIAWLPRKRGFVRTWDRDMFQQAIERLLSWESWNIRVKEEKQKIEQAIEDYRNKYLQDGEEWISKLREIEKIREAEITDVSYATKQGYLITRRELKGWEKVYEKWSKLIDAPLYDLKKVVTDVQNSMRREFSSAIFNILAEKKNRDIWVGQPNRLLHFAAYNVLLRKLQKAKDQATLTLPDPVNHPLWIRYDARGGNIHSYTIFQVDKMEVKVNLERMVWPNDSTWIEKEDITVHLAPSEQLYRQIAVQDNPSGKQEIDFIDYSSRVPLKGELIGSKIQFDRRYLENHTEELLAGNIGPVYLNLGVEVKHYQEMKNGRLRTPIGQSFTVKSLEWQKVIGFKAKELAEWMEQTAETNEKGIDSITEGLRIMSIDMGIRTSATVSVFEVVKNQPDNNKLFYKIQDTDLFAVHCRSILLNLPGEQVSKDIIKERDERYTERRFIKSQIRLLSKILQLNNQETQDGRKNILIGMIDTIESNKSLLNDQKQAWISKFNILAKNAYLDQVGWKQKLIEIHHEIEPVVGKLVSEWRRSFSKNQKNNKNRKNLAGLSMWNIDELEDTRRTLSSWSNRTRNPGEPKPIDPKFGINLLTHIQNLKDDRLKQMANLIVMTALGYKYDPGEKQKEERWKKAYPACHVILFEDLSRYRFNLDRTRLENSKLMKWGHRSIPKMVQMQGEIYGLLVGDVYSAFSSRFHAKTGAPGIRCHSLDEEDVNMLKNVSEIGGFDKLEDFKDLKREYYKLFGSVDKDYLAKMIERSDLIKSGTIIPKEGGELFITLAGHYKSNPKLSIIHADINAAQNLQRRFWQSNSEIFRVSCKLVKMSDGEYYIPKYSSKTFEKAMGKGRFIKNLDSEVYKWGNSSKMRIKTISTDKEIEFEEMEDFEQALEDAQEIQDGFKTMFRDPSGFFLATDKWLPQKEFWSMVKTVIHSRLRESSFSK